MKIYRALFVITVFAFNAANFGAVFGRTAAYARYLFLALLLIATVLLSARKQVKAPPVMLATFYVFALYGLATTFWTENFKLSALKWVLYVSLSSVLFLGGLAVPKASDENPFWPLKWVFVPLVLSSIFALIRGFGWFSGNFRGYCGNSNTLGATLFLTSPWLLFELRRSWSNERRRAALLGLSAAAAVVLLLTHSRAALGGMVVMSLFAVINLKPGRKLLLTYAAVLCLVFIYSFRPTAYDSIYHDWIEKRSEGVMHSRADQLQESWEAAKQGGIFGAGFGVTIGQSRYWDLQSFTEFSREKGNSMLAVAEELGAIGLLLYIALLYGTWMTLRRAATRFDQESWFLYTLGLGFFLGALLHSAFEAWFLSTGPDIAVYWCTLGLLIGSLNLPSRQVNERFHSLETANRARVLVPLPGPRS